MKKKYTYISQADKDFIRANWKLSNGVIARRIGCSVSAVAYQRMKMQVPPSCILWNKERVAQLADYLRKGYTMAEIAEAFGTTTTNLYSRIRLIRKQNS